MYYVITKGLGVDQMFIFFQLKTTQGTQGEEVENDPKTCLHNTWMVPNLNLEDREKIDPFLLKKNQ